jgi:hypothetical protein
MPHLNGQTAARYGSRDNPRAMIVERCNAYEAPLAFTALRKVALSKDKVLAALRSHSGNRCSALKEDD